jgi:hypothetical protein
LISKNQNYMKTLNSFICSLNQYSFSLVKLMALLMDIYIYIYKQMAEKTPNILKSKHCAL